MKRIVILLLAGAVCACARSSKSGETTTPQVRVDNDIIAVAPGSPVLERLTTGKVTATPYRATFTTSGMVQAIPARYAEIATPFAGRIVKSFVRLGQKVVQGSPIFEISSPSFFDTGKAYYQAKQEMELALKSLNREKDLLKNHVGVEKEVEEAEVNYELKKKDYENAVAALKVYQIDPGTMVLGQPLVVRSPIAGEVVKDNIVLKATDSPEFSSAKGYFLKKKAIRDYALKMQEKYDIRCTSVEQETRNLSGGNQQKVILARELEGSPDLLVAVHPTRGLDIGATRFVHDTMIEARDKGCGVLLISADFDEILEVSDRIVVMFEGQIMGVFSGKNPPIEEISLAMAGK